MRKLIDAFRPSSIRNSIAYTLVLPGTGRSPKADWRGWADMLLGDKAAAAEDGRAVLAFVSQQAETKWNRYFLRALTADGRLFVGDKAGAIEAAHAAIAAAPRSVDALNWATAASAASVTLAWTDAKDESVALLEELSTAMPGVAPAAITRVPNLTVPLANNPRYQALKAKLEAQMVENAKLLGAAR